MQKKLRQRETKRKLDRHNSPVWREFCVIVSCMCWPHRIKAKETRGSFCFISHPPKPWRTTRKQIDFWDWMRCTLEMKLDSLPKIWIEKIAPPYFCFPKKWTKVCVNYIHKPFCCQHCLKYRVECWQHILQGCIPVIHLVSLSHGTTRSCSLAWFRFLCHWQGKKR